MLPGSSPFSSISFDVVAAEASQRQILHGLDSLGAHPLLDVVGPSGFYGVTFRETSFRLLQWSLENTALNQLITIDNIGFDTNADSPGPGTPVPEPATASLVLCGFAGLVMRQRSSPANRRLRLFPGRHSWVSRFNFAV